MSNDTVTFKVEAGHVIVSTKRGDHLKIPFETWHQINDAIYKAIVKKTNESRAYA